MWIDLVVEGVKICSLPWPVLSTRQSICSSSQFWQFPISADLMIVLNYTLISSFDAVINSSVSLFQDVCSFFTHICGPVL